MIHSNLPFSPIIFLVFRDKSWDPSFRKALSTASLSIIHWAVSFEILLCSFFFFFFFSFEGEGNWIGKKPGWGEDAKKAPKDSLYASSSQASDHLYGLWRSVSTPNKPFWQYSLKKFPYPRTRPQLPNLPAIAHQSSMYANALLLGQDVDPLSSGGCWGKESWATT